MGDKFKDSLLLPQTSFPMKGHLPKREPDFIKIWSENRVYEKMVKKGKEPFFLLDGPPYANGDLHLGHVLNKVLKDITIKYKNLKGMQAPFIPTWDCHGLPIEMATLKKQKAQKDEVSKKDLRQACREEAQFWVERQKLSFQRLGVLAQWEKPILTMDSFYEAEEVRLMAQIAEQGLLVRGRKPVLWCFKLQTALAFSEAEYREHRSSSIYVKFEFVSESQKKLDCRPSSLVIWTTTAWTLPANAAVCLHPDLEYGLYECGKEFFLIACGLKEAFEKEVGLSLSPAKKVYKGKELENLLLKHPFLEREVPVILGDHVTLESGTGCVHTAPGHGLEDYKVGKQYQLKEHSPVDGRGHFDDSVPEDLRGVFIFKGNKIILEKLKQTGHLLGEKALVHSYPYNPRSDSPLIYRLTPQWFLKMDDPKKSIRKQAFQALEEKIQFIPSWAKSRLEGMLKNSPDWCLSRQRVWGVPLVVLYCKNCETPYFEPEWIKKVADEMEKTKQGIEYYFSTPCESLLPKNLKCDSCGGKEFKKGQDILDVWFDSGVEHAVVKKQVKEVSFPADLFLEGSDQHRGWFQTSLTSSLAIDGSVPFKTLLTHGFVNDKKGRKMSKSKGNVIDPLQVIEKQGAEILRLWVASEDYSQDINASEEIFKRVTETYRRFRNTMRFLLGNLSDFDLKKDLKNFSELAPVDRWALIQLHSLVKECDKFYDQFLFHKVYHQLNHFFTVTLSSFYLDIIKDRLYTFSQNSKERKQAQTVLYHLVQQLVVLMAPITTFLSEEVYGYFPWKDKESVLLDSFLKVNVSWKDEKTERLFEKLFP